MAQTLKVPTRRKIIEAALDLFSDAGYLKASVPAIAQKAGVSVGNIYRYFASKADILAAALPDGTTAAIEELAVSTLKFLSADLQPEGSASESENLLRRQSQGLAGFSREILFLFHGAEGTGYSEFPSRLRDALSAAFMEWSRSIGASPPRGGRAMAGILYEGFLKTASGVFRPGAGSERLEKDLRALIGYHRAGMKALAEQWKEGA